MERADADRFAKLLMMVAEQYGKLLSSDLILFYFDSLRSLSMHQVEFALEAHVKDPKVGQFMPKVADIIRQCEPGDEAEALEALQNLSSENPITDAVIKSMGGWRAHGMRDEQEWLRFGQADFLKRYAIYKKRFMFENNAAPKLMDLTKLLKRNAP